MSLREHIRRALCAAPPEAAPWPPVSAHTQESSAYVLYPRAPGRGSGCGLRVVGPSTIADIEQFLVLGAYGRPTAPLSLTAPLT